MELSFPELILIFAIALIALGPKDMIKTAQQLGRWMGKLRTEFGNMKVLLNEEILLDERKKLEELANKKIDLAPLAKEQAPREPAPKNPEVNDNPHG